MGMEQASSKEEDPNTCLDGFKILNSPKIAEERIILVPHKGTHEQGESNLTRPMLQKGCARTQTGLANTLTPNDPCL